MAYLRNRAVNRINLHSGIHALAAGMAGVFVLVFLLRVGLSIPSALCAMALIFAGRFSIRPAILVAAPNVAIPRAPEGAVSGLLLGRHIDAGHGRRAVAIAFSVVTATVILRALSVGTPWLAVSANALGALASCLLAPAQMTPVYNLAKAAPCALRFHIAAEGGWDVGCGSGCLVAAALASAGVDLASIMSLAFLGLAGQVLLLRRYYMRLRAW